MDSYNHNNGWCWVPPERWSWGDRGFHQSSDEIARFPRPQGGVGWRSYSNLGFFNVGDSTDFASKLPQFQNKSERHLFVLRGNSQLLWKTPSCCSSLVSCLSRGVSWAMAHQAVWTQVKQPLLTHHELPLWVSDPRPRDGGWRDGGWHGWGDCIPFLSPNYSSLISHLFVK